MRFELRIPPLLLFVVLALAMWLGRGEARGTGLLLVLATVLLLVGAVLGGGALLHFRRERTSVHPIRLQQSRVLVTQGVYRISRNPMYLGLLCWLLALACYLGAPGSGSARCCCWVGSPASRSCRRSGPCAPVSVSPMCNTAAV